MKYSKVRKVKSPVRGTSKSAGIDFFIPSDFQKTVLLPSTDILIPSGIKAKIPEGYMLFAADKSGVATSKQAMINAKKQPKKDSFRSSLIIGAKVIDEDYQGEIHLHIINVGNKPVIIRPDMKIAQLILIPVCYDDLQEVPEEELFDTKSERGDGSFNSTGRY